MIKRKNQRLEGYDYSTPGAYFVTICTKEKHCTLGSVVGGDDHIAPSVKLSEYGETVEKYIAGISGIDKFIVMPNHVHMIIKIDGPMWSSAPTKNISTIIRSFKIMVTKEAGTQLFQRSFYDHVIRNKEDYLRIWQYIDTNPQKWMLDRFYKEE